MRKDYAVITILDNLSETSMPWNEFVLYRHKHNPELKQYVIVCDSKKDSHNIPDGLDVTFTGFQAKKIRQAMKRILSECEAQNRDYVIHLHQTKSAVFYNIATCLKGYSKKTLFTVHNQFMAYDLKNKICSVLCALRAKNVTCVSDAAFAAYPVFVKKIKAGRITSIENGVDIERIDNVLKSFTFDSKENTVRRFVYVARMIPVKNHRFILDVFSKIQADWEMVFIGAEDADGEIRSKVNSDENLKKHVVFTGPISRNDVFKRLKQSDVYISPSKVEGLPVSVMEAMSTGLPVILSDIQPHCELKKGENAETIDVLPLDLNLWVEKINAYLAADNGALSQKGAGCRRIAEEFFSLDAMHKKYYAEYEKLLG